MAENTSIAMSADFLSAFAALPGPQQKRVRELITKFNQNPTAPGLNYERIRGGRDPWMRSLRIDRSYRAILRKAERGNVHVLLWAGPHDAAYAWAARHECLVNPETGALQVYEPKPETEPTGPTEDPTAATGRGTGAFRRLRERQLMGLGVPGAMLPEVRAVADDADLDAMQARLPVEAYEALFLYLAGSTYEELVRERQPIPPTSDPEDFGAAMTRADSRARFAIAHDQMELEAMLNAPLERWRVFLHPAQRQLVERDWNGPVRVLGGAGTGKTVVAMHRARWLARRAAPGERILLTTFTKNLALDIEQNLRSICTPEELARIEVTNLDRWVYGFLRARRYEFRIQYGRHPEAWARALDLKDPELGLSEGFYADEWERVVLDRGIQTQVEYRRVSRLGRGTALNRRSRSLVWRVFQEYRAQLAERGLKEVEDAFRDAAGLLERDRSGLPYSSIIVDEAQDMGVQAFRLLRGMVPEGPNDLFVVGDAHQRIYRRGQVVLARCGIRIVGRARKLRLNYRTTEETRRWATRLLHGRRVDDLNGGSDGHRVRSLTRGPEPVVKRFGSAEDEAKGVVRYLGALPPKELRSVCVVARTKKLRNAVRDAVRRAGCPVFRLSGATVDDETRDGVRFATMHRVKGLEFDRVVVVGVNRGMVPHLGAMNAAGDPVERRAAETAERSLLHVAATRAKKELLITSFGRPSPFLS